MTQQQQKRFSILAFILCIPIIILGFVAANFFKASNTCKDVAIKITNAKDASFVTADDVSTMLKNNTPVVKGQTKTKDIDIKKLEAIIQANPWVSDADLFFDNGNTLRINVTQRIPALRWLNGDISQNYLDTTGMVIPVTSNFGANVPIVTSNKLPVSLASTNLKLQLIGLAQYVKKDNFWNAAISQINVNQNSQIELYTSIADQKIVFGDTTMMQQKFDKLLKFYKEVAPRAGWDTYSEIDVTYKGQIVAKKKELNGTNVSQLTAPLKVTTTPKVGIQKANSYATITMPKVAKPIVKIKPIVTITKQTSGTQAATKKYNATVTKAKTVVKVKPIATVSKASNSPKPNMTKIKPIKNIIKSSTTKPTTH